MRKYGFEAAAEVAELISVLVHLHALAIVLDLRVHSIRAFLHGVLDGLAGFCLEKKEEEKAQRLRTHRCLGLIRSSPPWIMLTLKTNHQALLNIKVALTSMGCTGVISAASTLKIFLGPLPFDASC